jgi:copper chaperone CopZ
MKRNALVVPAILGALCLATSAWAGGSSCSGKSEGASKEASAGSHCTYGMKASMAAGKQCKFDANTAVFSYAVKDAHCGACVDKIQTTALSQKGVLCAKVDLNTKTAYIAGEKNMNQKAIAKAIKKAGFDCQLTAQGPKARAELVKLMAADNSAPAPKKS